jgi:uncharacterized protein (TIGR00369 family)
MTDIEELQALLAAQARPACAELTPFEIVAADLEAGSVRLQFAEQPAFRNHFGEIQGGFGVALADVCISLAAFAKHRKWLPTVEIKCSFLAPIPVGPCIGEGRVLKSGRGTVFLEAKLWAPDGSLAFHATATAHSRPE